MYGKNLSTISQCDVDINDVIKGSLQVSRNLLFTHWTNRKTI